jgi:hypothetical protein
MEYMLCKILLSKIQSHCVFLGVIGSLETANISISVFCINWFTSIGIRAKRFPFE